MKFVHSKLFFSSKKNLVLDTKKSAFKCKLRLLCMTGKHFSMEKEKTFHFGNGGNTEANPIEGIFLKKTKLVPNSVVLNLF